MQPLTVALDILQGEDNCFYGTLIPTLESLMTRTLEMKNGLQILVGLPDAVIQAVKTRFARVLGSEDVVLAAVTLPKFKLRWLHDQERKDLAKASLLAECRKLLPEQEQQQPGTSATDTTQRPGSSKEDEFFSFAENEEDTYATAEAEVAEVLHKVKQVNISK
ncbi:hypothetical protein ABVT39_014752 [Epinephelus coioides]